MAAELSHLLSVDQMKDKYKKNVKVKSMGKHDLHYACSVFISSVINWDSKGEYTLISVQCVLFIVLPTMISLYQYYCELR